MRKDVCKEKQNDNHNREKTHADKPINPPYELILLYSQRNIYREIIND